MRFARFRHVSTPFKGRLRCSKLQPGKGPGHFRGRGAFSERQGPPGPLHGPIVAAMGRFEAFQAGFGC